MNGVRIGRCGWIFVVLLAVALCGCGSSTVTKPPTSSCVNMGTAAYSGTEDVTISSGSCPSYTGLSVVFNIVQASGNCSFTLVNSRVSGTTFSGTASSDSTITWSGSYPQSTGTVTITGVSATLSDSLRTLKGYWTWTYSGNTQCTGKTTFNLTRQP